MEDSVKIWGFNGKVYFEAFNEDQGCVTAGIPVEVALDMIKDLSDAVDDADHV